MSRRIYVGVDLAKRCHQVAAVDANHQVVAEPFAIGRGRVGIEEMLSRLRFLVSGPADLVVTIEATSDWWWELSWELAERGSEVYLAHPKKAHDLRRFYAVHTKTDVTDAEALARMPLVDNGLQQLWRPSREQHSLLRLCRLRWKTRCRIADLKRRISHLSEIVVPGLDRVMPVRYSKSARVFLRRYLAPAKARRLGKKRLGQVLRRAAWGKLRDEKLDRLWQCIENAPRLGLGADDLLLEVGVQLDELEALERQIAVLDARITELYGDVDPEQRLLAQPGLGPFLAAGVTAVIGDVRRFSNSKALISYAGLAPRVKSSAGASKAGQGITKHGSPYLRAWLFVAAENARMYDPELKAYYQAMRKRGKHHLVAVCATAARLLDKAYALLMEGVTRREVESRAQSLNTG
jgi:transposase